MLRPDCRILIEHSTPLVAQDLREIVVLAGASEVAMTRADDASATGKLDLLITDAMGMSHDISGLFASAEAAARQTILVVSALRPMTNLPPNVRVLTEPFRTEDVMQALCDAGLMVPDAG